MFLRVVALSILLILMVPLIRPQPDPTLERDRQTLIFLFAALGLTILLIRLVTLSTGYFSAGNTWALGK